MKESERSKKVISSFKQFHQTVKIMENDEISTVIASLFLELDNRGANRKEILKNIKDGTTRIITNTK